MSNDNPSTAEASAIDEELVSYLDGELDAAAAARVERRMAEDPRYAARINQLQRAWDLLDTLQRTDPDDDFARSTVEMVTVQAVEEAKSQNLQVVRRRNLAWLAIVALLLLSAATAYAVFNHRLSLPDRQLVRDLPVIERVDQYRSIDSLEFLKQLERENLFTAEVDDGT
jgi:anti-sigma factor RsiW